MERRCRKYAEGRAALLIKLQHGIVGMPDRLLVRCDGVVIFIEFKRPGESLSKIQDYQLKRLQRMHQRTAVCAQLWHFKDLLTL